MDEADRTALETVLGHRFRSPRWLECALTHSSHRPELGGAPTGRGEAAPGDNERLEFLGDAILGLVVSRFLIETFPDWREGQLSKSRAQLVSSRALYHAAQRLDLGRYLRLGRGEEKTGGREKQAVLADAYEALVAAVFLDAGLDAAGEFVQRSLLEEALREHGLELGLPDHKSALQEWLQARGQGPAEYHVVREEGPDHRKRFWVEVAVGRQTLATAEGDNKKQAEQSAARLAIEHLRNPTPSL